MCWIEGVGEAVPAGGVGNLAHQCHGGGGVEEVEQLVLGALGHPGQQIQVELPADHRGQRQDLADGLAEAGHPGADHLAHAVGHRHRFEVGGGRPSAGVVLVDGAGL